VRLDVGFAGVVVLALRRLFVALTLFSLLHVDLLVGSDSDDY
jgi:hypothetical protein